MLSLLMFVVQNKTFFLTNTENYNLDTRQRNNLYLPQANLTIYQKGAYYLGINIFNNLPSEIKNVASNQKKFKIALKKCLYTYSFYTLEEYFSQMWINPLPVQFKTLLHGQKGCVFFSGHLNLCTAPETGLPSREKNHNN